MTKIEDEGKAKRDSIIARIRKLKAMTESRGASENESMFAAKRMAELIEEYNVQADELTLKEDSNHCVRDEYIDLSGKNYEWIHCLVVVGQIFKTKFWFTWDNQDPLDMGVMQRVLVLNFYGFPQDVEAAKVLTGIIHAGVVEETSKWIKAKNTKSAKKKFEHLDAFHAGMSYRMAERLTDMIPISKGRGLMVLKDQLVQDKFAEYCRKNDLRLTGARRKEVSDAAGQEQFNRGVAAGGNIDLNQSRFARPMVRG
jgi:hypothetical protein